MAASGVGMGEKAHGKNDIKKSERKAGQQRIGCMGFKAVGLTKKFQKMGDGHYEGQILKGLGQHINRIINTLENHKELGKHPGGDLDFLTEGQYENVN